MISYASISTHTFARNTFVQYTQYSSALFLGFDKGAIFENLLQAYKAKPGFIPTGFKYDKFAGYQQKI
jgi:hypothetical protein